MIQGMLLGEMCGSLRALRRRVDVVLAKGPGWTQLTGGRAFVACMGWPFGLVDLVRVRTEC